MHHKDVKPIFLVARHVHPHTIAAEFEVHACIFDIANSIQSKAGLTLAKENGADRYTLETKARKTNISVESPHKQNMSIPESPSTGFGFDALDSGRSNLPM